MSFFPVLNFWYFLYPTRFQYLIPKLYLGIFTHRFTYIQRYFAMHEYNRTQH